MKTAILLLVSMVPLLAGAAGEGGRLDTGAEGQRAEGQLSEEQLEAIFRSALVDYKNDAIKSCIEKCRKVVAVNPKHADSWNLLGAGFVNEREIEAARRCFLKAQKLAPSFTSAFNLAELDYIEDEWRGARTGFGKLLNENGVKQATKDLIRFKLMVIALKLSDEIGFRDHQLALKKREDPMLQDFVELLMKIDSEDLDEGDARALWKPLRKRHKGSAVYVDSLLEGYYMDAEG